MEIKKRGVEIGKGGEKEKGGGRRRKGTTHN